MSGKLFDQYGAILAEDVAVLERCLQIAMLGLGRPVRVLEIGMHDGNTARGIERFVATKGNGLLEYVGVDVDDGTTRPRYVPAAGRVVVGDSAETFHLWGDQPFDFVWVDACHCVNHVILETAHAAFLVRVGGFMCFHDVNPRIQMCATQGRQYHGPDIPEFNIAVARAHELIHFPWRNWELFAADWPTDVNDCGTAAYRRIS